MEVLPTQTRLLTGRKHARPPSPFIKPCSSPGLRPRSGPPRSLADGRPAAVAAVAAARPQSALVLSRRCTRSLRRGLWVPYT